MNGKKLISLILVLVMTVSLIVMPVSAETSGKVEKDYPFVFVHGLMGFGASDEIYDIVPYWGMTSCDIIDYLNGKGYESYAAKVGPLSSAWDRACELYAQLTGGTVDYGIAHSAEKGHDRYGITYEEPLFVGWGKVKKINLVGHSFGGATIRMFLDLLANGSEAEKKAAEDAGETVSPLFEGGKGDWVYSLTALSAPHNGSSYLECGGPIGDLLTEIVYDFDASLGLKSTAPLIDPQLEHFGLKPNKGENAIAFLNRVLGSKKFLSHNDNALYDLTIDNALAINDGIKMQKDVYYFSVYGVSTYKSPVSKNHLPAIDMLPLLSVPAAELGRYSGKYTAGGFYLDSSWLPNDGLVNEASAKYPFGSNGTPDAYNTCGNNTEIFEKGVWNVMPATPYDHISIIGGMLSNDAKSVKAVFDNIVQNVVRTYDTADAPVIPGKLDLFSFFADKWQQFFSVVRNAFAYIFSKF